MAGGVVGDDVVADAALLQLPGGEQGALQPRACLVDQDVDLLALLVRGEDDAERCAPIDGGQRAGVAVVEIVAPSSISSAPWKPMRRFSSTSASAIS
jgi:hypothetical protein